MGTPLRKLGQMGFNKIHLFHSWISWIITNMPCILWLWMFSRNRNQSYQLASLKTKGALYHAPIATTMRLKASLYVHQNTIETPSIYQPKPTTTLGSWCVAGQLVNALPGDQLTLNTQGMHGQSHVWPRSTVTRLPYVYNCHLSPFPSL